MMKKIMLMLTVLAALTLTGCSMNNERTGFILDAEAKDVSSGEDPYAAVRPSEDDESTTSSIVYSEKPVVSSSTTSSTKPITSTTSNVEKPASSSTVSSANPVVSSVASSTKPVEAPTTSNVEKPTVSSTTSSTKPVEAPVHSHTFTEATCEKPATCTTCGETKGNALGHKYNEGVCIICGKKDPNYVAVHNCKKDGHIWGEYYTKTYTEYFELKESHYVVANGFDITLAERYGCNTEPHFADIFGMVYSSGSKNVKTTATRTVTDYYHKCSECGTTEKYDTNKDVTTSDNWVLVKPNGACPIIWWDIDNIPDEVWEWVENDRQAKEDFFNSL